MVLGGPRKEENIILLLELLRPLLDFGGMN